MGSARKGLTNEITLQLRRASSHKFQLYLCTRCAMFFHLWSLFLYSLQLCRRRLAYILYESWLLGVFRIYTTLKPRSMQLQTSSNLDSRVVYTGNTPRNHDLYITYLFL